MNQNLISASVFYTRKHLDNATTFECAVLLAPVHDTHRAAYSFIVEVNGERATAEAVTYDRDAAECIFNKIVYENVNPCELETFISAIIE